MPAARLTPVDAQALWGAAVIPNDQFLIYAFAGAPDVEPALAAVRAAARGCPDLELRVHDRHRWTYPTWEHRPVGDDQFTVRDASGADWTGCLARIAGLAADQLDAGETTWRMHVFTGLRELPSGGGPGTVVVVQMAHALGDGIRSAALAARLLGRPAAVPALRTRAPWVGWALPRRARAAAAAHRTLERDERAGEVPRPAPSRPVLTSNARPAGPAGLRTLVRPRASLRGPTVTVAVLAAVSTALAAHLRDLGDDPAALGAEVPMAKPGPRRANNHFGNVGVDLLPAFDGARRAQGIADQLRARRARAAHPAVAAAARATETVPAVLLRRGIEGFDADARATEVTGNTVVSSVDRGAADLRFGTAAAILTTGLPALSPMMGLTHGVHGLGDVVAVSVHASAAAVGGPDGLDAYLARLDAALE